MGTELYTGFSEKWVFKRWTIGKNTIERIGLTRDVLETLYESE
jgi:hypothetical protein